MINIGSIKLPLNAATKTFAVLAKRGAGKTYTASVLAEEFSRNNIPFVAFDPIDVWWGLRLSADGKGKGLPVVVFGLEHADIQISRDDGARIAQAIVRENISCVISTFGMPKVAARQLIADFSDELLKINNTPRHVFIEEAHEFVPQRVFGAMARTFAAVEALVVMGRNRGIGVTLINQRAATVNKDVLTQLDTLLAFQNTAPQDRKALKDWVEAHAAEGDFDKFIQSLPSLPKGEGWIWSPEFMGVFEKIKIRKRETFHPDREKLGHKFEMPRIGQLDIEGFIEKFQKEKPAKDVKKGSEKVAEITTGTIVQALPDRALQDMRNSYESQLMEKDVEIRRLLGIINSAINILSGQGPRTTIEAPIVAQSGAVSLWKSKLGNGLASRLLTFFAENPQREFTREQVCLAVGISIRAGHTKNEFGKLMRTGTVVRNGNVYKLNPSL